MTRGLCHCVILFVLISCGGVLMLNTSWDLTENHVVGLPSAEPDTQHLTDDSYIIMDRPFKDVSQEEFEERLKHSKSVEEVLRIFFEDGDKMSDLNINSIMNMKSKHVYGTSTRRQDGRGGPEHRYMNDDEEDEEEERQLAYEHYQDMDISPLGECKYPRPEIEYVQSHDPSSIRHFYPECTVVYRCRNTTGCCPPGTVCAPKKQNGIRIFEKYFLVFERTPMTSQRMVRPSYRNFVDSRAFINHTACECQDLEITSNCHKDCPRQFAKRRRGTDCVCECVHNNRRCRYMHRGSLPLAESDLECIKRDECIVPGCATGKFRVHTGFCPKHRHYRG